MSTISISKTEKAEPFHCERCDKDKKSRSVGVWVKDDGTEVVICNGCYGWLNANEPGVRKL